MQAKTFIIGIHGLGNKPPRGVLERWWRLSLSEGLRRHTGKRPFFDFRLVYWADYLNPEPTDPNEKDPEHPLYLTEPYHTALEETDAAGDGHDAPRPFKKKVKSQLTRMLLSDPFMHAFPAVTESVMKKRFKEIELYYSSDAVGKAKATAQEELRSILSEALAKYRKRRIVLIGHSMGSLIACDVLYSLGFEIDTFITAGSPLGIPLIAEKIREEQCAAVASQGGQDSHSGHNGHGGHNKDKKLKAPEAITGAWYNLYDPQDELACHYRLGEVFAHNSAGVAPQDLEVTNDYRIGERVNPHKIYGYLRCREISEILLKLITANKSERRLRAENGISDILFKLGRWFH
ncbi:MAG: alpha/beta hydrolase [Acidobacteriota bacterium]|jgi:hypothetical protein|nr:alpha/beta hydrolase [Acidobacteriota bacterium]